jgi:sulfatase modifying factor 1
MKTINSSNSFSAVLIVTAVVALSGRGDPAHADTFGSGTNTFNITFVNIGNPGNPADMTGDPNPAGSVPNVYRMDKFEISEQMVDKANTLGGLAITKNTRGADKPATSVSWNEATRFVNWLNTSTGSTPAYKFAIQPGQGGYDSNADIELWAPGDAGYDPNNLYRNSVARYFLPSVDEWYKAAYYDPTSGIYYDYPTGSNTAPTAVASGKSVGTAIYIGQAGPADITLAGGLSPYGTMGQGGNAYEWEETDFDLVNGPDDGSSARDIRGGYWENEPFVLQSSLSGNASPSEQQPEFGFRVASIAELPGDFNHNGTIDAADYVVWRKSDSAPAGYNQWRSHFGVPSGNGSSSAGVSQAAVPEPANLVLLILMAAGWCPWRHRMRRSPNNP